MARRLRGERTGRRIGPVSGLTRRTFAVEPAQLEALEREAMRRAQDRGTLKPDAGELVREALAAWLKTRG